MLTVLLQPGSMVMELIAASWASACAVWMFRRAMVAALSTAYSTGAQQIDSLLTPQIVPFVLL